MWTGNPIPMTPQKKILIISGVKPFPGNSGQQMRVRNSLRALRRQFHVTFLTVGKKNEIPAIKQALGNYVDESLVLPSLATDGGLRGLFYKVMSALYSVVTGLKRSNFILGRVELTPHRVREFCDLRRYDLVLFEYWHTHRIAKYCNQTGIPAVLDMHDILWQTYRVYLARHRSPLVKFLAPMYLSAYKRAEESAWRQYDRLIAISQGEAEYLKGRIPDYKILQISMGIDLEKWPFNRRPVKPPRFGFFGSMSGEQNRRQARYCVREIMPLIWRKLPLAEFWIIGANPTEDLLALQSDDRINVTGFVEDVQAVLSELTAVQCPWEGTYGFRSRLVEVMCLGCPVIATPDAVSGMGFEREKGLFISRKKEDFAAISLKLAEDEKWSQTMSRAARKQIEEKYSFQATYGRLAEELGKLVSKK